MKAESPNYQRPLSAYKLFDWSSVGAVVLEGDSDGPTRIEYLGHHFTRRSGGGKFGQAIWFSRPQGKNEDGSNRYARLITFKDYSEAEELDGRIDLEEETPPAKANGRQPAPARPTPPPPAPKTTTPTTDPIPQKDWELDAMTSTDPLIFDTAVVHAIPWFKDATQVATARESMFGSSWVKGYAPAYLAGLQIYAQKREEMEASGVPTTAAHKQAKSDAIARYNRELDAVERIPA